MFLKQPRFIRVKLLSGRYFSPESPSSVAQETLQWCLCRQSFPARTHEYTTNGLEMSYESLIPSALEVTRAHAGWPKSTHKLPLTLNSVIWCSSENGRRWADPMACHMDPVDGSLSEHHVGLIYLLQCTDTAQEVLSPWPLQSTLPLQSLSLWARCSWSHWGISCSRCTKNAACKHAGQDAAGQWGTAVGAGGSSETQLQAVTTISVFVSMSY